MLRLHTGVNFQVNLATLKFRGVGYGRGHPLGNDVINVDLE